MTITALPAFVADATAALIAALDAVPGIDRVQDGEPYRLDATTLTLDPRAVAAGHFTEADGTLHGWIVTVEARDVPSATREDHVMLRFRVLGFRQMTAALTSRSAFRAIVLAAMDALRHTTLDDTVEFTDPVRSRLDDEALTEERPVAGVLCHVAEFELTGHQWLTF